MAKTLVAIRADLSDAAMITWLEKSDLAYYNTDTPILTDAEYDTLRRQARKQLGEGHPYFKRVGAPPSGTRKVKHVVPMGSLDNVHNLEELTAWRQHEVTDKSICLQHKLDGLTVELIYEEGHFVQAITRGDGVEGDDVTRNVARSGNIPMTLENFGVEFLNDSASVRAECVLYLSDFKKHFKGDANPRNSAAGTLRRQSGERAEFLRFIAFDLAMYNPEETGVNYTDTEMETLHQLKDFGFDVVSGRVVRNTNVIWRHVKSVESDRDKLDFEVDGIVAKVNSKEDYFKLGIRDLRPRGQRAIKFTPRGGTTRLVKVVWQVGKTGRITPVAKLKPVHVGGTTIRSATLCNMDEIGRLGVALNDTVEVVRAADVIPKIARVVRKHKKRIKIVPPEKCPGCDGLLEKTGADYYCRNADCQAQIYRRILGWVKKRNILYLGESSLHALCAKYVVDTITDIYYFTIDDWAALSIGNGRLGESRAESISRELNKSKDVSLSDFLGSLGIPHCGRSLSRAACTALKPASLADVFKWTPGRVTSVEKFGKERALAFCSWLKYHREEVENLAGWMRFKEAPGKKENAVSSDALKGKSVCFTGNADMKRAKLQNIVEDNGGVAKSSVTKDLDILVLADVNSESSKACKARAQGTELMSVSDFLKIVAWDA